MMIPAEVSIISCHVGSRSFSIYRAY